MLRLPSLLSLFLIIDCTTDVFIFWGYPTDGTDGCVNTTSSSFDACVTTCTNSTTCMLAYGNDNSCMLCDMFLVNTVAQSDKANGVKTAIKVDAPTDGCPSDMESEEYTRTETNDEYNVTYYNGVWTISYENKTCLDDTWTKFYRPLGQWCVKMFGESTTITRDSASTNCSGIGAAMSGIQTAEEAAFMIASSKSLSGTMTTYEYTGFWMDGVRLGTCNFSGAEDTTACAGLLAFAFTDTYLSSFSQYTFVSGQPDSVVDRGTRHNCLSLLVGQSETTTEGYTTNNV
ncbi:unnamed protein product [Caenorhabditis sp. 36 PRJEB53466]|nr:unnamed protein product [Caenorhabditis sp. 36 PRJEB53466]